jgi:antitoxin (DNA-binding transcriptional repressor) of toxin-antitoxin stability system
VKTIPVRELRNEYGRILKEIEETGESYVITNHGHVVAQIGPPPQPTGPREGVPVRDLAGLPGTLTTEAAEDLRRDLAEADWAAEDPWERWDRTRADQPEQ